MAGPHVAGLVALIISANPDLAGQVDLIEEIIMDTAVPKTSDEDCGNIAGTEIPNNTYGYGRIDALAAVQLALVTTSVGTDFSDNAVKVYPNPADESINFELNSFEGKTQLEIFDVSGKQFITKQIEAIDGKIENVSLYGLPAGVYFYKITNAENNFEGKLVKN